MAETLEENLKKIEETTDKLKQVMIEIDKYHNLPVRGEGDNRLYNKNLDKRDNLAINLNYLQNQVIIEKHNQIIKYFNGPKNK